MFSGSPKKIREEELEDARKSGSANPQVQNESEDVDIKGAASTQPDDENIDPNDVLPTPSNITSSASAFGKHHVTPDPEAEWENPFDEDEEDDY